MSAAIEAEGLTLRFGDVEALVGVDLWATEGTVHALLGPNGAGKTTLVRILATLQRPHGGTANVAGLDVVRDASRLRERIGLAGQYAAVDEDLTGRENLDLFGRLHGMSRRGARARAGELLEEFDLGHAAMRLVSTYSGGMRRRLDLAAALIARPKVVFLDEPTTGLDPRSRLALWSAIDDLVAGGTTVLLTTQYLDEAERLADRVSVVDHGRVVAEGAVDDLKAGVGGHRLEITLTDTSQADAVIAELQSVATGLVEVRDDIVLVPVSAHGGVPLAALSRLNDDGVAVSDVAVRRPTLDDVVLALTGRASAGGGA